MKCFLLKMKINGIKSIKEEIVLDFFNNSVAKQFDSFETKLKTYSNVLIKKAFVYYSRSLFKSDLLILKRQVYGYGVINQG